MKNATILPSCSESPRLCVSLLWITGDPLFLCQPIWVEGYRKSEPFLILTVYFTLAISGQGGLPPCGAKEGGRRKEEGGFNEAFLFSTSGEVALVGDQDAVSECSLFGLAYARLITGYYLWI
ncbi:MULTISPECIES: hypothetical protein [Pseudomonas]|uniref:hypothetical protein n=1 Tax=Pseudomonas TaxID=286 RepID=UPI001475FD7B|nr:MULTISPECIES: hypothetical protein [Pseudomonas]MBM1204806.1 hypothetical protein [Pseudomonas fragi]MBM1204902.1 hypothetical protein [Pseudomonas fragi]NMY57982.1 hypothetical protein [Pseudomonas sp. WS 5051]